MTKKTYQQLSESERHAIALGLQQKQSLSAMARALGRSKSTISRECSRNGGGNGYVSKFAQQRSDRRRIHTRPGPKLHREGSLFKFVCDHLRQHWSPQQIAGELKRLHPNNKRQRVSTRASTPASMPSLGESSKRSWCPVCAWHVPSAGLAPKARIGVDKSPIS